MSEIVRYATEEYVDSKNMTDEDFKSALKDRDMPFFYSVSITHPGCLVGDFNNYITEGENFSIKFGAPKAGSLGIQKVTMDGVDISQNEGVIVNETRPDAVYIELAVYIENVTGDIEIVARGQRPPR